MALQERQFSMDGYVFGLPSDEVMLLENGLDVGGYDIRSQDRERSSGDGVFFGRDFHTPPTWTFKLGVKAIDGDVMGALRRLGAVWRGDRFRGVPGAYTALSYRLGGQERVVYGRPRRFFADPDPTWQSDWKMVTADFRLMDSRSYGPLRSLTLDLVSTASVGGLVFPAQFPWSFSPTEAVRSGAVVVDSTIGSPFVVKIAGPVSGTASNFRISSTGWSFKLDTYLAPAGNIVIDTATGVATRNSSVFGAASAVTDWRAELRPGPQEVLFSADDPTASSTATIEWREAASTY